LIGTGSLVPNAEVKGPADDCLEGDSNSDANFKSSAMVSKSDDELRREWGGVRPPLDLPFVWW
jgi:hypothetical protein